MKPIKVGDLVVIHNLFDEGPSPLCIVTKQHREYPQLFNLYEIKTGTKRHFIHREVLKVATDK